MGAFITSATAEGKEIVTINGRAEGAPKSGYEGNTFVQLRRARQEESHFNWMGRNVKEVVARGILILDSTDVACLAWFIRANIKLDLSESFVSPAAVNQLITVCDEFKLRKIKVAEGSQITLPLMVGGMLTGLTLAVKARCEDIGFTVTQAYSL